MSLTIWKYAIPVESEAVVEMPEGAEILTVQLQDGQPAIWARVNGAGKRVPRTFRWRGTGHAANGVGAYVGTVQAGPLVFHLFVDAEERR